MRPTSVWRRAVVGNGARPQAGTKLPLATYILHRLRQHGCEAIHGVPGDFTLPFLSYVERANMKWIGSCNELNAAYAADGYARVTGLGAVCTTFGVGELSAINGIAGSYAERVPVVHIVGSPSTNTRKLYPRGGKGTFQGLVHHALGRGQDLDLYSNLYKSVTADVLRLSEPGCHTRRIDDTLRTCLTTKTPVYMELPSDMASMDVDASDLSEPYELNRDSTTSDRDSSIKDSILRDLKGAKRPLIMIDGLAARFGTTQSLNELVERTDIPTVVTTHGLGIVDSHHPSYYGIYTGKLGNQQIHDYVQQSDCVLLFGELFSDTATVGWTAVPPEASTASFSGSVATYKGRTEHCDINKMLEILLEQYSPQRAPLDATGLSYAELLPRKEALVIRPPDTKPDDPVTQDYLWPRLSSFFRSKDNILLANGTPLIGGAMFSLPRQVRVIASGLWFSIGQMLPAAQGVALAQRSLPEDQRGRTILLEGDGSFQTTAQELSTIIKLKLDMTILMANNRGYAYERLIQGPDADYNGVADWDYTLAPAMLGGNAPGAQEGYPIVSERVETVGQLEELLGSERIQETRGLKFVEVMMGEKDVPKYFLPALEGAGKKLGGCAMDRGAETMTELGSGQ
ncbi:uncharacterized protein HMPREF1541_08768 [Cyphellophora europaea CBS 101466]|uniref:Pyruvate decarboxylase n=1 Tax=Cyphellophora europaea (strain CBS 101466) TaxID=1220924 RepID=W2RJH6_CYPE1|nr:uncharacterized protein HMPREF1541_08768 [Cyphellophora europaea CBS 101466]ETN36490.1 hypothetical protein HMPREF1541_08768 [Cyphellophora europaea CBS 101466]